MNHHLLLIVHLICAAIWVGGHLYLAVCQLPKILKKKDVQSLLRFEKSYEPLGMPSLLLLVITGIWMALQMGVPVSDWFSFSNPIERVVSVKVSLLLTTVAFALSAQFYVIPQLKKGVDKLGLMAFHIIGVTLIGILMLVFGSYIRYGGF